MKQGPAAGAARRRRSAPHRRRKFRAISRGSSVAGVITSGAVRSGRVARAVASPPDYKWVENWGDIMKHFTDLWMAKRHDSAVRGDRSKAGCAMPISPRVNNINNSKGLEQ